MNLVKKVIMIMLVLFVSCGMSLPVNAAEEEKPYRVVFVGNSGVGKTSLFNRMTRNEFKIEPTVCALTYKVKCRDVALELWDTAGQEKFRSMTPLYMRNANVVVIVLDQNDDYETMEEQRLYWRDFIKENAPEGAIIYVLANKKDGEIVKENAEDISNIRELCKVEGFLFAETSAKTGEGIEEFLDCLVDALKENESKTPSYQTVEIKLETENNNPGIIQLDGQESAGYWSYFSCC